MLNENKEYWLCISEKVYYRIMDTQALLYNTETGEYMRTDNPEIIKLLQLLYKKDDLGTIRCNAKTLANSPYKEFINEFCAKQLGELIELSQTTERPVRLIPILNLQHDIDRVHNDPEYNIGENILKNLLQLNIYLNTKCKRSCALCNTYYRQCLCCMKSAEKQTQELDFTILKKLLYQIQYSAVGKLNLLGGNVFEYPYFREIDSLIKDFKGRIHIWNHLDHFLSEDFLISNFNYDAIVTFPIDKVIFNKRARAWKDVNFRYHFFISDINEYKESDRLIQEFEIDNYFIHPVFTGENLNFFEENVYTDTEDIFTNPLPFHRIFARQKLNTNFFGQLTVFPDGAIYANVNSPSLGNAGTDTLLDIIKKEMVENTAWRHIRNETPCSDCLYQYLCSSPSNYEIVIKRANLCHITENRN